MSFARGEVAVGRAKAGNSVLGGEQAAVRSAHAHSSGLKGAMGSAS